MRDKTEKLIKKPEALHLRVRELEQLEEEHERTEEALRQSGEKYRSLFKNMLDGFAYCQIIVDENNKPIDFVYLEVNDAFERLTGLKKEDVVGKKVTEAIPGIKEAHPELFSIYGKVALTGEPTEFDIYFEPLAIWFTISVYSPQKGYFAAVFTNITERKQAEETLRKLSRAVEQSPSTVVITDTKANIEYVNPKFTQLTGYTCEEVIGKNPRILQSNELPAEEYKRLWEAITAGSEWRGEFPNRKKNDDLYWESASISPIKNQEGVITHFVKVAEDITERKQAEEELKMRAQLLDAVTDSIFLRDLNEHFVYLNTTAYQTRGYSRDEMMAMNLRDVVATESSGLIEQHTNESLENDHATFEMTHIRKDKSIMPVEITTSIIESGGKKLILAVARDITERKKAEEENERLLLAYKEQNQIIINSNFELEKALTRAKQAEEKMRKSEERYRLLADNVTDVIWTMDMDLRFTYVSPSVTSMLGYSAEEAMAQTLAGILTPASFKIAMKALAEELTIKNMERKNLSRSRTLELEERRKDGSTLWLESKMTFLRDPNGHTVGILGVTRDITERKRMEEQLQQSKVLASLGKMIAGIAHEVNNPLGSILLYSELLLKDDVPHQTKKDLRVIHNEAKRAARIMTDLLTYSNGVKFQMRRLNLHRILKKVLEMRRYEERVQNINVSSNLRDGPLYIQGDSSQLTQVFMNLILNTEEALKERNGGNIVITTQIDAEWAKVSIADDGIGIPEEHLNQVFHPFFTTKKVGEGTGLGLSTCYGIITAHGGLIRAENNEMGGATFTVDLPLTKARRQVSLRQGTEKASLITT